MGQSPANDLPDPAENPAPAATQNTDELLAQMAGDEIDRLLAEAEVPPAGAAPASGETQPAIAQAALDAPPAELTALPAAPAPDSPTAEQVDTDTAQQLDALFAQLTETPTPEPAAPIEPARAAPRPVSSAARAPAEPAEPAPSPQLSQELDDLFRELSSPAATFDATPAQSPDPSAPPAPALAEQSINPADQTGSLEKQVLASELIQAASAAEEQARLARRNRPSLLLRFLVWINKPIEGCSDQFRSLLGKAALVTLVNAMLLLAWVLLIRRR